MKTKLNILMVLALLALLVAAPAARVQAQEPVIPDFTWTPLEPPQGDYMVDNQPNVVFTPTAETLAAYPGDSWFSNWDIKGPYATRDDPYASCSPWVGYITDHSQGIGHLLQAPGYWLVCVEMVQNDNYASVSPMNQFWVLVTNTAPLVGFQGPIPPVLVGQSISPYALVGYIDHSFSGQILTTCKVNFGDDTGDQDGTWYMGSPQCYGPPHAYTAAGTYNFTVTATDPDGLTGSGSTPIQVVAKEAAAIVSNIQLSYKAGKSGYTYTSLVTIADGNGKPLNKAVVDAYWILPDGTKVTQQATTGRNGVATFRNVKDGSGTVHFNVSGITKTGYTFVPFLTHASIDVP